MEKLNRLKGAEVEKFKKTTKKVLSEEEIESYDELYRKLEGIEKGQIVISYEAVDRDYGSYEAEQEIPFLIEFRTKIMEETKNLLN